MLEIWLLTGFFAKKFSSYLQILNAISF
jgi:hypothetical protein